MTVAEELFLSCLKNKDLDTLSSVKREWLDASEFSQYREITKHYKTHGTFIGISTYCKVFGLDKSLGDSHPKYYFKHLRDRYTTYELSERLPNLLKKINKSPNSVLRGIKTLAHELQHDDDDTVRDTSYGDNPLKRLAALKKRGEQKGITYLPMGHEVLDTLFMGYRQNDLITLGGRAGSKKCLGKDTPIRMFDGSVKMSQHIKVGDKIMGDDGTVRNVLALYGGREMMYWVHQNKGMSYRVNESHILSLKNRTPKNERKTINGKRVHVGTSYKDRNQVVNITVRDYLPKSKTYKKYHKGYKGKLDKLPEQDISIDPYFLGMWLGDGSKRDMTITTVHYSIIRYLHEFAALHGLTVTQNGISYSLTNVNGSKSNINPLVREFRKYDLLDNKRNKTDRGSKHIPKEFLLNSRAVRLQVLAGLLDSDGCFANGCYHITQTRKQLAEDIAFLARGLGIYVHINKHVTKLKSRNYEGEAYTLCLSGDFSEIPTKIRYKKATKRLINKDALVTGITVEKDCVDDFYGFEIDGNHLFCLEDLTVTHNTWLICFLCVLLEDIMFENGIDGDILFVTNEISDEEIAERMDCIRYSLPYNDFLRGSLSKRELRRYQAGLEDLEERGSKVILSYGCETMEMFQQKIDLYKPKAAFLDGSYLMNPGEAEGWEKITKITRNLKLITRRKGIPVFNTTQLRKGTGTKGKSTAFDAQDDFAYSNSYVQDSDLALRSFQTPDMIYRSEHGIQIAKGRRVDSSTDLIFEAPLANMHLDFKINDDDNDTEDTVDW